MVKESIGINTEGRVVAEVPMDMHPSKKADWEVLGFSFRKIRDKEAYKVTLPDGWLIRLHNENRIGSILDTNGLVRGAINYSLECPHMFLETRYCVVCDQIKVKNAQGELEDAVDIYFGNDEIRWFEAGIVAFSNEKYREISDKYIEMAEKYADENYPEWESIYAYWDEKPCVKQKTK